MDQEDQEYPKTFVGLLSAVLLVEITLGLVFNISVLIVGGRGAAGNNERGNTFLASLSVVDVVCCLISLPLTLTTTLKSRFHDDLALCMFFEGATSLSSTSSSLTLLLISLERYQAVMRPMQRGVLSSRPALFLAIVWAVSLFAFSAPFFLFGTDTVMDKFNNNSTVMRSEAVGSNSSLSASNSATETSPNFTETSTLSIASNTNDGGSDAKSGDFRNGMSTEFGDTANITANPSDDLLDNINSVTFADELCSFRVTCSCVLNNSRFFKIYEVVYVTAFFCTTFAMAMFCLAILRVVRRRVAAKEAAANRQTTMLSAMASTSREGKPTMIGAKANNVITVATLEVPETSSSTSTAISEERDRATTNEVEGYFGPQPHSFTSGQGIVRFKPLQEVATLNATEFCESRPKGRFSPNYFALKEATAASDIVHSQNNAECTHTPRDDVLNKLTKTSSNCDSNLRKNLSRSHHAASYSHQNCLRTQKYGVRFIRNSASDHSSARTQQNNFSQTSSNYAEIPQNSVAVPQGGAQIHGNGAQSLSSGAQIRINTTEMLQNSPQIQSSRNSFQIPQNNNSSVQRNLPRTLKSNFLALASKFRPSTKQNNEQLASMGMSWVQRQQQRRPRLQGRRRLGHQEEGGRTPQTVASAIAQERRVLQTSFGIACAFLFCWGPHMIVTIIEMVVKDNLMLESVHLVSLSLAYFTVVVHPLIYAFSRKKFREALSRPWRRYRLRRNTAAVVTVARTASNR